MGKWTPNCFFNIEWCIVFVLDQWIRRTFVLWHSEDVENCRINYENCEKMEVVVMYFTIRVTSFIHKWTE
jgi:hypothetical protein